MTKKETTALKALIKMNGWKKKGGHADATRDKVLRLLKEAGFKSKRKHTSASPDASWVSGTDYFTHPLGLVAEFSEYLGNHADYNRHSFYVRCGKRNLK